MVIEPKGIANTPDTRHSIPYGEETIMDLLAKFTWDEAGASSVEYALLLTFIALAIMVSVTTFGAALRDSFINSNNKMFGG